MSPLLKLRNPRLSPYLPSHIQLPSPSHSPPIVDILPLPPGLAAILSGRASEMQSRSARRGGRPMRVGVGAMMTRHGGFATPTIINGEIDETVAPQRQLLGGLQDPSRLPSELADTSGPTIGKAPRAKGLKVQVDSSWFLENVIILWGYLVGVIEYLIIAVSKKDDADKDSTMSHLLLITLITMHLAFITNALTNFFCSHSSSTIVAISIICPCSNLDIGKTIY